MKTKILIACCLVFNLLNAQTVKWDYPVKPGTPEWSAFLTHDEMLNACLIPSEILNTLSTEELVILCLNYPIRFDFYAYTSLNEGLKKVVSNFNGLQELSKRKDNVEFLLNRLKSIELEKLPFGILSQTEIGEVIVGLTLTELFLSQESVLENATPGQLKEIASIALKNTLLKESHPQLYSQHSVEASTYLLCIGLAKLNNGVVTSSNVESFLSSGTFIGSSKSEIIGELIQIFSKTLIQ